MPVLVPWPSSSPGASQPIVDFDWWAPPRRLLPSNPWLTEALIVEAAITIVEETESQVHPLVVGPALNLPLVPLALGVDVDRLVVGSVVALPALAVAPAIDYARPSFEPPTRQSELPAEDIGEASARAAQPPVELETTGSHALEST